MTTTISTEPFWDYSATTGPNKWASLCPEFAAAANYPYQSPIAISSSSLSNSKPELKPLQFNYQSQVFISEHFTQSLHLVPAKFINELIFNDQSYTLQDIHLHMPNEHIINGIEQPLEIHYVHRTQNNDVLVVAIFFEQNDQANPLTLIDWREEAQFEFNPADLLPDTSNYYTYSGSLTTPPTIGPVTWVLIDDVQTAQPTWIQAIESQLPAANARPVQPLNGRPVYHS